MNDQHPTMELHLAAFGTCDACGQEVWFRIAVTGGDSLAIPADTDCPYCGVKSRIDAEHFLDTVSGIGG